MQLLRRFLVVQALLFWQGGFLFYAAVVVPTGTDVLGSIGQGRVTRHVTDWMNVIGAVAVANPGVGPVSPMGPATPRTRWGLWSILAAGSDVVALIPIESDSIAGDRRRPATTPRSTSGTGSTCTCDGAVGCRTGLCRRHVAGVGEAAAG